MWYVSTLSISDPDPQGSLLPYYIPYPSENNARKKPILLSYFLILVIPFFINFQKLQLHRVSKDRVGSKHFDFNIKRSHFLIIIK